MNSYLLFSSKPFSQQGENDWAAGHWHWGWRLAVLGSLLPSYFSSCHKLLLNTLLSNLGRVFSFLLVTPAFLHTVLLPVKTHRRKNMSAMVPSVALSVSVVSLKQEGSIIMGRSEGHNTDGKQRCFYSPELFSCLAKVPALLVFLASTLASIPVVCCLGRKQIL